jgi:hypothetical protein
MDVVCVSGGRTGVAANSRGRADRIRPTRRHRKSAWNAVVYPAFKVVVTLALAGCALFWLGSRVSRPFTLYARERADVSELSSKLQGIHSENDGLRRAIGYMDTAEGKAQAGRWSGLVKKGERRLLIPEEPSGATGTE